MEFMKTKTRFLCVYLFKQLIPRYYNNIHVPFSHIYPESINYFSVELVISVLKKRKSYDIYRHGDVKINITNNQIKSRPTERKF